MVVYQSFIKEFKKNLHLHNDCCHNVRNSVVFIKSLQFSCLAANFARNRVRVHIQRFGPDGQEDQHRSICAPESNGAAGDGRGGARYRHPTPGQCHQLQLPLQGQALST